MLIHAFDKADDSRCLYADDVHVSENWRKWIDRGDIDSSGIVRTTFARTPDEILTMMMVNKILMIQP